MLVTLLAATIVAGAVPQTYSATYAAAAGSGIAFRASTNVGPSGSGNITGNRPTGTAENDILIGLLYYEPRSATYAPPAGWTEFAAQDSSATGDFRLRAYWKRAGASEPASYTFTTTNGAWRQLMIAAYSGAATAGSPIDASAGQSSTATTTSIAAPSITTTVAGALAVFVGGHWGTPSYTPATGYTERAGDGTSIHLADRAYPAAGATGAPTATAGTAGWVAAIHFALKAIAGPDTTPPTVTANTPANGATNVPTGTSVTATFSEDMDAATIGTATFELHQGDATGPLVAATVSYNATTRVATLQPNAALAASTQYTAVVKGGAADPRVKDASGNALAADHTWSFTTAAATPGSDQIGQWSSVLAWPHIAVHLVLLPNGKVLTFQSGTLASVWDPATGTFTTVPNNSSDIFCSGHAMLPDGRVLVVGGDGEARIGLADANIFNPTTQTWTSAPQMNYERWYPTATTLGDGRVLTVAGWDTCEGCDVTIPEVYNPATNTWTQLTSASLSLPYYPHMFVLPDGRVAQVGTQPTATVTRVLDVTQQTWTTVDSRIIDGASAAMYAPGKIMKSGTAADDGETGNARATTYVIDMNQPAPAWRQTAPMALPRSYMNLTPLPDGTVLVTGGGVTKDGYDNSKAVKEAEIWDPATETWTTMARMATPRLYHSTALLLPDGRVLVSGGGGNGGNPPDQKNAEIFSPPYLFKGPRPTIQSAPGTVAYGGTFSVQTPDAASIAKVMLIRTGAVTHAFDQNTRAVPLSFQQVADGLEVQAPANGNLAPPGYYMLFIVNGSGVPSVASFVRL